MKLYIVSDIHGFADEMQAALDKAGFEANNDGHLLISCGDMFDRGNQPYEAMQYFNSITNKVLVRGNHEDLLIECIERRYCLGHDIQNGTADTVMDLADAMFGYNKNRPFDVACELIENTVKNFIDQTVNYFETENYIFVHSWVPLVRLDDMPKHYTKGRVFAKMDDWRNASDTEWESARWGNPFDLAKRGLLPDKTLVFGHWHTSWPRHHWKWSDDAEAEWGNGADFSPYYGNGYIGLDACTAHSGNVNVVVLEDTLLEE